MALVREGERPARVPVVSDPYRIGRDPGCHLVIEDPRVAPHHARLRYLKGEYVVSAEGGAPLAVNGRAVPLLPLRTGDVVTLTPAADPRPVSLRFDSRIEGSFHPPGTSLGAAWLRHPAVAHAADGPGRFGPGEPLAGRDPRRCRRARGPAGEGAVVVKVTGPARTPEEADRWLRVLETLAGAPHPEVARVVDGGVVAEGEGPVRWLACAWEDGVSLADRLRRGPLPVAEALGALRALARGLAHLHRRGVLHRDVAPGNVLLRPGGAVLLDLGQAVPRDDPGRPGRGVVGTPGFVAPEVVVGASPTAAADVHGLAAVGYAMLTGAPPAEGGDVLEALARAGAPPLRPRDLGVRVPEALEAALMSALDRDPAVRPSAEALERALAFAEAAAAVGGTP